MLQIKQLSKKLSALPLFAATSPENLKNWLLALQQSIAQIGAGEQIEGDKQLGVLLAGKLRIQSADSGRCVILRELRAPAVFGAASLFCAGAQPLSRIEAMTACTVLLVDAEAVRALMTADSGFRDGYLAFLADRVQFLNRKILCFTAGSAERRLALWLCGEERDTVTLPTSLASLSDMLNLGRASLYRALDKLEADGLIARNGRTITLISKDELLKKYQ